jgi:uncharacterized repeat protein (TIGR03943 family)
MRWSPMRLLTSAVLLGWAALFWFLMLSGRTALYLSARTDWVVPVGAVLMTIAALGRLATSRTSHAEPFEARDMLRTAVVAIPIIAVLALPPTSLGTYAATRRSNFVSGEIATDPTSIATGRLELTDVAGALRSQEGARALADRAGTEVAFVGFVARERGMPADQFQLTRFLISCCVADALSVQVRVAGVRPGKFKEEEWVKVTGKIYPVGDEVVIDAQEIERVSRPKRPYLNA